MYRRFILLIFLIGNTGYAASGGPDAYGYTFIDSTEAAGPEFLWIPPSADAQKVVLNGDDTASTSPPSDGIGAPVDLGFPLTYYGATYDRLVPCVNGYISGDPAATGADRTPDCPLPATPDLDVGKLRLYPFHANLLIDDVVYYKYYDISPHPHSCLGVSIFTWGGASEPDGGTVQFQALLFDNGDILYQYNVDCTTESVTIGIQQDSLPSGLTYACSSTGLTIPAGTAVLIEQPKITVNTAEDQLDSPAGPEISLREAVRDIPAGGKIMLQWGSGIHYVTNGSGSINIKKPLHIDGRQNPGKPVLSGKGSDEGLLRVTDADAVSFASLIFRDAAPTNSSLGAVTLEDSASQADWTALCDVDFVFNRNQRALKSTGDVNTRVYRCRFRSTVDSGAIRTGGGGTLWVYDSEFAFNGGTSNSVPSNLHGSAIMVSASELFVRNSSFFNNQTSGRGLIYTFQSPFLIHDSTFSQNHSGEYGSAVVALAGSNLTNEIRRCTFVENGPLPAVYMDSGGSTVLSRNAFIDSTIYTTNASTIVSEGYNLSSIVDANLIHAADIVNADPGLGPLGPYGGFSLSHLPLRGSPVVDAGGPGSVPPDQRGVPRPLNGDGAGSAFIDIGAVEAGVPLEVTTKTDEDDGIGVGGVSLRDAINAATDGQHIVFHSSLSGETITPTNGTMAVGVKRLHIDASNLTRPLKIDASSVPFHVFTTTRPISFHGLQAYSGWRFIEANDDLVTDRCSFRAFSSRALYCHEDFVGERCVLRDNVGSVSALRLGGSENAWNNRIIRSWFDGNRQVNDPFGSGGAIYSGSPGLMIDQSTFSQNYAFRGGAVYAGGEGGFQEIYVLRSTFSGNSAAQGGALSCYYLTGAGTVMQNTFYGNRAADEGGALYVRPFNDLVSFGHNVFAKNRVLSDGALEHIRAQHPPSSFSLGFNLTDNAESEFSHPDDILNETPRLTPLAWHNRATVPSHYPLVESPVIDAGGYGPTDYWIATRDSIDQARIQDGTDNGTRTIDIGAVEAAEPIFVSTHIDEYNTPSGANLSLREALRDAEDGARIIFENSQYPAGQNTIDLASGQNVELTITNSVIIDATAAKDFGLNLEGITLSGPTTNRVVDIEGGGHDVALYGISIKNGNAVLPDSTGGGLRNIGGRLTMTHGMIYSNNAATDGGGVLVNNGEALFENMTFYDNFADDQGGAIFAWNVSYLQMQHSTVAYNRSDNDGAGFHLFQTELDLYSSIVGENQRTGGTYKNAQLSSGSFITSRGYNLADSPLTTNAMDQLNTPINLLNTIVDAGGLAPVLVPVNASTAVDHGPVFFWGPPCTDARGFARVFGPRPDVGAFELGSLDSFGNPPINTDGDNMDDWWEIYFLNGTGQTDSGNPDGDNDDNETEYANETHPGFANHPLRIVDFTVDTNHVTVTWNSWPNHVYTVQSSTDGPSGNWDGLNQLETGEVFDTNTVVTLPLNQFTDEHTGFRIKRY